MPIPTDAKLEKMTRDELRDVARSNKLSGYSSLAKPALILLLKDARSTKSAKGGKAKAPAKPKAKTPAKKSPAKKPKTVPSLADLMEMTIAQLQAIAAKESIEAPKRIRKEDLAKMIRKDMLAKKSKKAETKAPAKAKAKAPAKAKEKCLDKDERCPGEICDTETGKCVRKTKTNRPYGEAKLKTTYGSKYHYNEKHGLVGRFASVMEHLKALGLVEEESSSEESSSEEEAKEKCYDEDAEPCDEGEICFAESGMCVEDSSEVRGLVSPSEGGMFVLSVNNKTILGTLRAVTDFQKVLGGTITPAIAPSVSTSAAISTRCWEKEAVPCPDGTICSGAERSGRCIKDDARARKDKFILEVNGRPILGEKDRLEKLQSTLGGTIRAATEEEASQEPLRTAAAAEEAEEEEVSAEGEEEEKEVETAPEEPKKAEDPLEEQRRSKIQEAFRACLEKENLL